MKKPVAKKPAPKVAVKPKAKVTTSRGSNTRKQVEDMNQREWFNAQRDVKQKRSKSGNIIGSTIPGFKVSKAMADLEGFDVEDERKRQRAGGGLTRKNVNTVNLMDSASNKNRRAIKKTVSKNYTKVESARLNKQSKPKPPAMPAGKPKAKGKR